MMGKTDKTYRYRHLARIIIEAASPLAVGSGEKDIETDSLVARDVNGLPYIPGTTIAGVLRHTAGYGAKTDCIFGFVDGDKGAGSQIFFTDARMIGHDGMVVDGLRDDLDNEFYSHFKTLPIRQHVRIGHKGVTDEGGKFDEQVVFKGTRFCFEVEVMYDSDNDRGNDSDNKIDCLLKNFTSGTLRIGGGTRSGFGDIKVISLQTKTLDLNKPEDLAFYINKSSSLTTEWVDSDKPDVMTPSSWDKYEISLNPDDFFIFGSGFGDDAADMTPVKESIIVWEDDKPRFETGCILIPATSIKGAVAHRTAFYYNKSTEVFADIIPKDKYGDYVCKNNTAVKVLFGSDGDKEKKEKITRGHVLFSDIIEKRDVDDKILNHVAIDRFTGGAISGALFSEKTTHIKDSDKPFTTTIYVDRSAYMNPKIEQKVRQAFENALMDICKGMLPLGGGVNRGNGSFNGTLIKNGITLYPKDTK